MQKRLFSFETGVFRFYGLFLIADIDTVMGNSTNVTDRSINTYAKYVRLYIMQGTQMGFDGYARMYESKFITNRRSERMRKWMIVLTVLCSIITTAGCSKAAKQPSPSNGQAQMQEDRTDEVFTLRVSYWAEDKNGYFEAVEKKFKDEISERNYQVGQIGCENVCRSYR